MVVGDIGATGFFADVRVIDVFGVVDPVIAHSQVTGFGQGKPGHEKRGEAAYLLQKKPTYIKWGYIDEQVDRTQYDLMTDFPSDLKVPGLWVRKSQ
ncbi:MAG: hypothetical protein HY073_02725 [Deltaproteobacteria bacterium]|nr:hypothetical protein [Deltaproteobacteria bacterium]